MTAYVLGLVTITDPSFLKEYGPAVQAQVEANGGRYIARGGEFDHLDGDGADPTVIVILEFPTVEAARKWHGSSEYAPYLKARLAGSTGDLYLIDGV